MDLRTELIAKYDRETAKTRKMLEAIPANADFNYTPHPKSMTLGKLAGHVTDMVGAWALSALTQDKLEVLPGKKFEGYVVTNKAEMLAKFDRDLVTVRAALVAVTPAQWEEHWKFIANGHTLVDDVRHQVFRETVVSHMIHHRAQLGVYLRLLDQPVPGMYGPSADEK
jgi:uncharacterized damage-inducible protein DinB